jgi:hypothetical protein
MLETAGFTATRPKDLTLALWSFDAPGIGPYTALSVIVNIMAAVAVVSWMWIRYCGAVK